MSLIILPTELDQILILIESTMKELFFTTTIDSPNAYDLVYDTFQFFYQNMCFLVNFEHKILPKEDLLDCLKNQSVFKVAVDDTLTLVFDFTFYISYLECTNMIYVMHWSRKVGNLQHIRCV